MILLKFGYAKNKRWYAVFSHIIRIFERLSSGIDASHCYVELIDGNMNFRIESVYPKGRITLNGNFDKKYDDVEYYYFKTEKTIFESLEWFEKNIKHKEYSISQNVLLGLANIASVIFSKIEFIEFNGRAKQNCTEAQIMALEHFLNIYPTEGLDNFTVSEARNLVKSVWELKGIKL